MSSGEIGGGKINNKAEMVTFSVHHYFHQEDDVFAGVCLFFSQSVSLFFVQQ